MNKLSLIALASALPCSPALADGGVPEFGANGELVPPSDYREWVFAGGGLGMTYGPTRTEPGQPPLFTILFVNPQAYRLFSASGKWPEGTFLIMEIRRSSQHDSIDGAGRVQGDLLLVEALVKDSDRFGDEGWAFFAFDEKEESYAPLPRSATCYGCHASHGAVDWTFTQFYPDLIDIARSFGTVRDDYDPTRQIE